MDIPRSWDEAAKIAMARIAMKEIGVKAYLLVTKGRTTYLKLSYADKTRVLHEYGEGFTYDVTDGSSITLCVADTASTGPKIDVTASPATLVALRTRLNAK